MTLSLVWMESWYLDQGFGAGVECAAEVVEVAVTDIGAAVHQADTWMSRRGSKP